MIGLDQSFESSFAGAIHTEAGKYHASSLAANVNQQTAAAFAHVRKYRPIHPVDGKNIRLEDLTRLFDGHGFRKPTNSKSRVVDEHIDLPGCSHHLRYGTIHGSVISHIEFHRAKRQRFPLPKRLNLAGI